MNIRLPRPPYLLITPERAKDLRDACPGNAQIAQAVDRLMFDYRSEDAQRAVLALLERWQATDLRPEEVVPSRAHLEDLRYVARDAGDHHAVGRYREALYPDEMGYIPTSRESLAAQRAHSAWNQRAARLRAAGVVPLDAIE